MRPGLLPQRNEEQFMSADAADVEGADTITVVEGFNAMRMFLVTALRRQGKRDEEIEFIVGGLTWTDGAPTDPMMWGDWLAAIGSLRSEPSR
jgi:hypothetical protein